MIKDSVQKSIPTVATFFLDHDLQILNYSPQLPEFIHKDNSGHEISLTSKKLIYSKLIPDAKLTLKDYQPRQKELIDNEGNTYLAILLPYHELDHKTGLIVSLTNITEKRNREMSLLKKEKRQSFLIKLNDQIRNLDDADMIREYACRLLKDYLKNEVIFFSDLSPLEDHYDSYSEFSSDDFMIFLKKSGLHYQLITEGHLHEGVPLIIENTAQNKTISKNLLQKCMDHQIGAALIFPLLKNKKLEWTLNIFYNTPHNFSRDKLELIAEVAERTWREAERAHAEQAMKEAKKYAESIVDTLHEALVVLTPELKVKSANQAFYNLFKVDKQDTEGTLIFELGNRQWDIPLLRQLLEDVLPENNIFHDFEVSHTFEKIGHKVMLVNAQRLDHVQLILLGLRDITEQKKWEQELETAKFEAERAIRIKEDFLAHMSHEIRTPLNTVVGLSHLLLEQPYNKQQYNNLNVLKTAAINLNHLVDNIFDFGRIQSGESKTEPKEINIRQFVEGIIKVHQPVAQSKSIQLKLKVYDKVPVKVVTEPPKLMQILNNLIGNALKFTNVGSVKLSVSLSKQTNEQALIEFSIRDTGIGIEPRQVETIFNEFYQVDSSTLKKYGGTGLGLAITRLYLKMMDSEIKVESQLGGGSRFWFQLPVKILKKVNEDENTSAHKSGKASLSNINILIVEDDDFSRIMLKQLLMMWGIKHDEAVNGQEAVDMAAKNSYDIILMDVHMPIMDGYKATKILREMPQYKNKPIVALSADVSRKVKDEVNSGLFTGNKVKPIVPEMLLEYISELIS